METAIKKAEVGQITLRHTEDVDGLSDVCALCGAEYDRDGSGFYYFLVDTKKSVCDVCAESNVPELAAIRREAFCFARRAIMGGVEGILGVLIDVLDNKLKASDEGLIVKYILQVVADQYKVYVQNYEISNLRYAVLDVYGNC